MPNRAWPTIEPTHIVGSPVTMVPPSEVGACALERYFRISISVYKRDREIELEGEREREIAIYKKGQSLRLVPF